MRQWQEIGESDWFYCENDSWFKYCEKSPEHNTRESTNGEVEVYKGQFEKIKQASKK